MQRIWQKQYPPNVPYDIDIDQYDSVLEIFHRSVKKYADRDAYISSNYAITFADLDQLSKQFALYLQNDLGLKKGDRMAIMLPNVLQYPIAVLAALRIGVVVVNMDPLFTQREISIQLNDSGAETLLVLNNFASEVEKALPNITVKNVILAKAGDCFPWAKGMVLNMLTKYMHKLIPSYSIDSANHNVCTFKEALKKYKGASQTVLAEAELSHSDLLFLQYTGGTTGTPKGVELTHGNMVANILMSVDWLKSAIKSDTHIMFAPLPMYHIFCMSANLMSGLYLGFTNILVANPRNFEGFIKLLQSTKPNSLIAVNTLLRKLLDTDGFDEIDFSELSLTFAGGMAVTSDVAEEWKQRTGSTIVQAYGLSETSPGVCSMPMHVEKFNGSIGLPLPSTDIKILSDDDEEVGVNELGELCVKGPQVMRCYWQRPDATAEVMTDDGYFRTGDYVRIDEQGYLYILDRKKDMILVSGFNVFPNELEDVLNQHPNIIESAAIGVEDDKAGQVVKLFVVRDNSALTVDDVMAYCKENFTGYKRPKQIEFIDELPKSNVGKILRKELR